MGSQTLVQTLPKCTFCGQKAEFDGRTVMGSWAYMCELHFWQYGVGLGTGRGQKLAVKPVPTEKAASDAAFTSWMKEVDAAVEISAGLSCYDLPDVAYRDFFEAGMNASDVAEEVLAEAEMDMSW